MNKTILRIRIESPSISRSHHLFLEIEETEKAFLEVNKLLKALLGVCYDKDE